MICWRGSHLFHCLVEMSYGHLFEDFSQGRPHIWCLTFKFSHFGLCWGCHNHQSRSFLLVNWPSSLRNKGVGSAVYSESLWPLLFLVHLLMICWRGSHLFHRLVEILSYLWRNLMLHLKIWSLEFCWRVGICSFDKHLHQSWIWWWLEGAVCWWCRTLMTCLFQLNELLCPPPEFLVLPICVSTRC